MSTRKRAGSSATTRRPLTRERILRAALDLIDRDGVQGLSMRKLGAELGVEAMSLYNHVPDKDAVLDGVVELLWEQAAAKVDDAGRWQSQARALAAAIRETAHAHPSAYPLVMTRGVLPQPVFRLGGRLLSSLREGGFGELAPHAMLALASHATSQALAEVTWYGQPPPTGEVTDVEQWPLIVGPAAELPRYDVDAAFTLGLELLIEALEARLARQQV